MKFSLLLAGAFLSIATLRAQEIPYYLLENKQPQVEDHEHYQHDIKKRYAHLLNKPQSAVMRRPYDVLTYDLYMDWVPPLSKTAVTWTARQYLGLNRIGLKIDSANVSRITLNAGTLRIDSVHIGGVRVQNVSQPVNGEFTISLPAALPQGTIANLDVYYTYIGEENDGFFLYPKGQFVGFGQNNDSVFVEERLAYTMSEPEDARDWMPCNDLPYDKAKATIRVRVPEGFVVSSNGLLSDVSTLNGTTTFVWSDTTQIATYLMVVNASKFAQYSEWYKRVSNPNDSIEVKYYVWPRDYENTALDGSYNARNAFKNTVPMLEAYSRFLTEYPFVKYGMTAVQPFNFGGMEHQTMTTVLRRWLRGFDDAGIAHEIMHQWTGDLVTCATWNDIWLNEGGATWGEALWNESWGGKEWYLRSMISKRTAYFNQGGLNQPPIYGIGVANLFNYATTYAKSSWIYHMLRTTLGDEVFFPALRNYLNTYAFQSIETEDMVALFEKEVPNPPVPFRTFFDQWIYQAGHPQYNLSVNAFSNGSGSFTAQATMRQIQSGVNVPPVFVMPVKITFKNKAGQEEIRIMYNNQREQIAEFTLPFAPDSIFLDRNDDILCQKSVFFAGTQTGVEGEPTQADVFTMAPNPLRTGETAQIEYIAYTQKNIRIEIVNFLGQTVEVLKEGFVTPGSYLLGFQPKGLAAGVYMVRLSSDSGTQNQSFVVIN
ncbi:MAG TPA: M1 family aminopeptidase [Patescibacteria group bacterium]|nr:M1 family aminopeptidase [Patescibacteria group bacterium]